MFSWWSDVKNPSSEWFVILSAFLKDHEMNSYTLDTIGIENVCLQYLVDPNYFACAIYISHEYLPISIDTVLSNFVTQQTKKTVIWAVTFQLAHFKTL